jgi:hypothetical protein
MKLSEYLKTRNKQSFQYVGTIFGTSQDDWTPTGEEVVKFLEEIPGMDGEIIEHPTNGGEGGFYFQSDSIHYKSGIIQEEVLKTI